MARALVYRPALCALSLAGALLLLGSGVASASDSRGKKVATIKMRVASARALRQPLMCVRNAKRGRRVARRHLKRCAWRRASASKTPHELYWGATIGSHLTGTQAPWDMSAVSTFEREVGKPMSIVQLFSAFSDCGSGSCSPIRFPTDPFEAVRRHGSIPLLSWSSQSIPWSVNEPDYQLSDIISGRYDTYIREFAEEARDWGHPFFLRFDWEMNKSWFAWSEEANGNQAGEYVAAWRHVHDIFAAVGATGATWVWCPYVDPAGSTSSMASVYPGDSYVDWTCLDGYNWGTNPSHPSGWQSFDQLFGSTYSRIAEGIAPSKPMMIAEFGSSEHGGSKAKWIEDALSRVTLDYPQIKAAVWFDVFADGMDWPIETSRSASAAFASGIQSASFSGDRFSELPLAPIQPPA